MLCALVNWIQGHQCLVRITCACSDNTIRISGVSGHMFNNVPEGDHSVIVRCTSADGLMNASSTVSGLRFLSVRLTLEPSGTSITVVPQANIEATHMQVQVG